MALYDYEQMFEGGAQWPPDSEVERLNRYDANKKLFEGRFPEVFVDWPRLLREDMSATLEFVLNWFKRLSLLSADLCLGEPPGFYAGEKESPEQMTVQRIVDETRLVNESYQVVIDMSRLGDGLYKVWRDDVLHVQAMRPDIWFPVVEPRNVKQTLAHVLAWQTEKIRRGPLGGVQSEWELEVEIHEKGQVTYRTYEQHRRGDAMVGVMGRLLEENVEQTGVDEFLVVPVTNLPTPDRVTGIDDYTDLQSVVQELCVRLAQIARILDVHADPNMYGPPQSTVLDENGERVLKLRGRYFPVPPGQTPPGYVTWDGRLESAFSEIDFLMKQLYVLSETGAAALGQLEGGLAESGSALRRLMMAPLAKVNRMRMQLGPALEHVLTVASKVEVAAGVPESVVLENVRVEWQDGLPRDDNEQATIETQMKTAGLTSAESAMRRFYGYDEEEVEAELKRIEDEEPEPPEPPVVTMPTSDEPQEQ